MLEVEVTRVREMEVEAMVRPEAAPVMVVEAAVRTAFL